MKNKSYRRVDRGGLTLDDRFITKRFKDSFINNIEQMRYRLAIERSKLSRMKKKARKEYVLKNSFKVDDKKICPSCKKNRNSFVSIGGIVVCYNCKGIKIS